MGQCHAICYLFKKAKTFFASVEFKNNSLVFLFQTIIWYWYCFPSSVAMGWNLRPIRYMTHTATRWVRDWFRYGKWRRRWLWSSFIAGHACQVGKIWSVRDWCVWIYEAGVPFFIAQNAYCSWDSYFQFKKVSRSVILRAIMQRLYESASAIGLPRHYRLLFLAL